MQDDKQQNQKKQWQQRLFRLIKLSLILTTVAGMAFLVNRFIYRSKATQDVAKLSFLSPQTNVQKEQIFQSNFQINVEGKRVSGVDLTFDYEPEALEYVTQGNDLLSSSTLPNQYFTALILEKVDPNSTDNLKQVRIILVANKPDNELHHSVVISLKFKALKATEKTILRLNKSRSQVVGTTGAINSLDHTFALDDQNAYSEITITEPGSETTNCSSQTQCGPNASCSENQSCVCNSGFYDCDNDLTNGCESNQACQSNGNIQLKLSVKLQGVDRTPATTKRLPFKISLIGSENNKQGPQTVELTASERNDGIFEGMVEFNQLQPEANFRLLIKGPKHLQKRICDPKPTGMYTYHCSGNQSFPLSTGINEIDLTQAPLLTGDLPLPKQDGILNSNDTVAIQNCMVNPNDNCKQQTDVNFDGVTNGTDLILVINSMGIKYDDEIQL